MPEALTPQEKANLEALVKKILAHYGFKKPPVPVERILQEPPQGLLNAVDLSDLSLVFGMGEHRHEYRMAIARLLYREICRQQASENGPLPYTSEAGRYFAAALLIPETWIQQATLWPWSNLQKLSETFQVPEYVMAARLAQLGKSVRGMK
ncbi:MAG: ImmA/IrrE family metallo-endopeptidase [Anaerolineae bacterium]